MAEDRTIEQHAAVLDAEPVATPRSVHYPDSDGRFLPENPLQANAIVNLRFALTEHFHRARVVLEGDMFLYYEEGNPAKSISPDVFVVLDHDLGERMTYKLWEEGKPPDFAMEVVSPSSQVRNRKDKKELYQRLGIGEYFVFQPDQAWPEPRLVGYRLEGGAYLEVEPEAGWGPAGALRSKKLGVSLRGEGPKLRVRDLETGRDYPWIEENRAIREAEVEARRQEAEARQRAEARAELEVVARRRAEARADFEAKARRREGTQAAARIAELEAELGERRRGGN